MKHDREFWTHHVERWRASGLTQKAYCARRRLAKGSLGYWASTLGRLKASVTDLVEVGRTEIKPQPSSCPIEIAVQGRYLLRLWPGVDPEQLREVLSVLESRG
jgi:hypothetical protein